MCIQTESAEPSWRLSTTKHNTKHNTTENTPQHNTPDHSTPHDNYQGLKSCQASSNRALPVCIAAHTLSVLLRSMERSFHRSTHGSSLRVGLDCTPRGACGGSSFKAALGTAGTEALPCAWIRGEGLARFGRRGLRSGRLRRWAPCSPTRRS